VINLDLYIVSACETREHKTGRAHLSSNVMSIMLAVSGAPHAIFINLGLTDLGYKDLRKLKCLSLHRVVHMYAQSEY
jgi:hypothetical protein